MNAIVIISLLAAVVLAIVHLLAGEMSFLDGTPRRSIWLSIAGGISVAYVFVHLLPDLAKEQQTIRKTVEEAFAFVEEEFAFVESHAYLVALLGLVVFYGLERAVKTSRGRRRREGEEDTTGAGVFRLHIAFFAVYNALIGYLLFPREQPGPEQQRLGSLIFFALAMGVHFVVNDFGLREDHKGRYDQIGRCRRPNTQSGWRRRPNARFWQFGRPNTQPWQWILATAVMAGWVVGRLCVVSEAAIAVLSAFLAGGVIMNVLKEELPPERKSRFWAFPVGAFAYAVILLTYTYFVWRPGK
jgi:hypothetical protein